MSTRKRIASALTAAVMLASSAQAALAAETGWLTRGEAAAMLIAAAVDYNPGVN